MCCRTTSGDPLLLEISTGPAGIELYRGDSLAPRTALGPRTPLVLHLDTNKPANVQFTLGLAPDSPILCATPGPCVVEVQYRLRDKQNSIYLVREEGMVLAVCPDEFKRKDKNFDLLRHAVITSVKETGKPPVAATNDTQLLVHFGVQ